MKMHVTYQKCFASKKLRIFMNLKKNETSNNNRNMPIYINGQIMMIFIFVYSKILLNSPFNDRPTVLT